MKFLFNILLALTISACHKSNERGYLTEESKAEKTKSVAVGQAELICKEYAEGQNFSLLKQKRIADLAKFGIPIENLDKMDKALDNKLYEYNSSQFDECVRLLFDSKI